MFLQCITHVQYPGRGGALFYLKKGEMKHQICCLGKDDAKLLGELCPPLLQPIRGFCLPLDVSFISCRHTD